MSYTRHILAGFSLWRSSKEALQIQAIRCMMSLLSSEQSRFVSQEMG